MIDKIIEWSINNKFMVILATVFIIVGGLYAMSETPLDAIPDLSDVQVIVYTEYAGQAPEVVEDQITYPLTTAMLSVPFAKVVRGYSFFGISFVYIIFEDGTDLYWARSRVLEYLNFVSGRLPSGVAPSLGPDATGVGWVYEYVLKDTDGKHDLQELRGLQDWYLRYELTAVPGVELTEMRRSGPAAMCCAGGTWSNCDRYAKQIQVQRLREARATLALSCAYHDHFHVSYS